jgi:hypothetical protein
MSEEMSERATEIAELTVMNDGQQAISVSQISDLSQREWWIGCPIRRRIE